MYCLGQVSLELSGVKEKQVAAAYVILARVFLAILAKFAVFI